MPLPVSHPARPAPTNGLLLVTGETARTPSTQRSIFDGHIRISQAYYDADEFDEPAMHGSQKFLLCSSLDQDEENPREARKSFFACEEDGNAFVSGEAGDSGSAYTATAKFIHPFESDE